MSDAELIADLIARLVAVELRLKAIEERHAKIDGAWLGPDGTPMPHGVGG